jgi:hypothetical protein
MPVQRAGRPLPSAQGGAAEALDSRSADATALLLTGRRYDTFLGQSERRSVKKSKSSPIIFINSTNPNRTTEMSQIFDYSLTVIENDRTSWNQN